MQIKGKQVQPASTTDAGVVTTTAQSFAGAKTFTANCDITYSAPASVSFTLVNPNTGGTADTRYLLNNGTFGGGVILRGLNSIVQPHRVTLYSAAGTSSSVSLNVNGSDAVVLTPTAFTSSVPFTGSLTGNASTATALQTGRTFSLTGDATGTSAAFTGAANASIPVTLAASGVTAGTYGSSSAVPVLVLNAKGLVTGASNTPLTSMGVVTTSDANTDYGQGFRAFIYGAGANYPTAIGTALEVRRTSGSASVAGTFQLAVSNAVDETINFRKATGYSAGDVWTSWRTLIHTGNVATYAVPVGGNAGTATALQTGRTFSLTGDATGTSAAFTGAANASIPVTLANVATAGTSTKVTYDAKGRVTSGTSLAAADIPVLDWSKITTGQTNLAAIESIAGTSGLLRKTGAGTWALDTAAVLSEVTGSFTPVAVGTTTAGTGTYTAQLGTFVKTGSLVTFSLTIGWSAHTGTGNLVITGLPYVATGTSTWLFQSCYAVGLTLPSGATQLLASLNPGSSTIVISGIDGVSGTIASVAMASSVSTLRISGSYMT